MFVTKKKSFDEAYNGTFRTVAESPNLSIDRIPTGVWSVDRVLEGGIPVGRIVEFAGDPATSKSTMALSVAKSVIAKGGEVLYIDLENSLTDDYLRFVGIDPSSPQFYIADSRSAEEVLDMIIHAVDEERFDLIILDSVASLTSQAELEGEMGDANVGQIPRLLSKFTRKLMVEYTSSKTTVLLINQFRDTIGGFGYGPTKKTTGGRAINYYASLRIEFIKIETLKKNGTDVIGSKIKFKVVKSKVSRPGIETEFEHHHAFGIDYVGNVVDLAVKYGIVNKSGAWFSYGEHKIQGSDKLRQLFVDDPTLLVELQSQVAEAIAAE